MQITELLYASLGDALKEIWFYIVIIFATLLGCAVFCTCGVAVSLFFCYNYFSNRSENSKAYNRAVAQYDGAAAFTDAGAQISAERTQQRKQNIKRAAMVAL